MVTKRVLCPSRLRQVPPHFSWVDHRLVREDHIRRCEADAWALYLFLVTVADAQGLSYYGDTTLARQLSMAGERLARARHALIGADLIAFEAPLYQVLSLDTAPTPDPRGDGPVRLDALLRRLAARR